MGDSVFTSPSQQPAIGPARQADIKTPISIPDHAEPPAWLAWARRHWAGLTLCLILLAAAALRLYILAASYFIGDGDEALTGVMAKHILEGERPVFTYGQTYMAATEAYFTALLYVLVGVQSWAQKIGPLLASLVVVGLNYSLARFYLGSKLAGLLAAALTALPSLYFAVIGLRAWNHSTETMAGGSLLLLVAWAILWGQPARPAGQPRWGKYSRRDWLLWTGLGLVAGVGFYGHMLIIYYYLPVIFFFFLKDKLFMLRPPALATLAGFLLGSLPWWLYNLQNNWATVAYFLRPTGGRKEAALDVLGHYAAYSWPLATGAYNYWFTPSRLSGLFLTGLYCLALLCWLVARRQGIAGWLRLSFQPARPVDLLLLFALLSPLIYLAWGAGNVAFTALDTTGRYLLPLLGLLPVIVGGGLAALAGWLPGWLRQKKWAAGRESSLALGLAALLAVGVIMANLSEYRKADFVAVFQSPYFPELRPPLDNGPLITYLKSQGIEYATCNHWAGNRIILDSAEAVKCVDYHDLTLGGLDRFARYTPKILEPVRRVAFVILNLSDGADPLERKLKSLGVVYTRRDILPYIVIIPVSRSVSPQEVVEELHYPL